MVEAAEGANVSSGHVRPVWQPISAVSVQWLAREWSGLAAFCFPLLLYFFTLAPTFFSLDSAELTTAVATNGILRSTGYPLYVVVGRIWLAVLPPVGDVGYRMNLLSAMCGALTILFVERILRHLRVEAWERLAAVGLLACASMFWSMSLVAEVYTLHTALLTAVIFLLLRWSVAPAPVRLFWPALLAGLSLGNHLSTVLLIPGYVWFVLVHRPDYLRKPRFWLVGLVALLASVAIYLILPLNFRASPAFNYAGHFDATGTFLAVDLSTVDGLWWLISGTTFQGLMFGYRLAELPVEIGRFAREFWIAFFAIGVGPGIAGIVALWRKDWRFASTWTWLFVPTAVFFINYRVPDKNTMFLPLFVLWAIALGVGYQWLSELLRQGSPTSRRPWISRAIVLGAVLLALAWNWSQVDLSHDWSSRQESEAMLQQVEADAVVLGRWRTIPGLQYLQLVEGQRPDVKLINRFLISHQDMRQYILAEVAHRPVYIDDLYYGLPPGVTAAEAGSLFLLSGSGAPHVQSR